VTGLVPPVVAINLTDVLALWGALLSTALAAYKVAEYRRDRPIVKISLMPGMKATPGSAYGDMNLLVVRVANVGRRPVVITHVSLRLPPGGEASHLLCFDTLTAKYPVEITEGHAHSFIFNEDEVRKAGVTPSNCIVLVNDARGVDHWNCGRLTRLWKLGTLRY
jgi:hypothetical protein